MKRRLKLDVSPEIQTAKPGTSKGSDHDRSDGGEESVKDDIPDELQLAIAKTMAALTAGNDDSMTCESDEDKLKIVQDIEQSGSELDDLLDNRSQDIKLTIVNVKSILKVS